MHFKEFMIWTGHISISFLHLEEFNGTPSAGYGKNLIGLPNMLIDKVMVIFKAPELEAIDKSQKKESLPE